MAWLNIFSSTKEEAREKNYKMQYFDKLSNSSEVVNMSAITNYLEQKYGGQTAGLDFFSSELLANLYVAENTNKLSRIAKYRQMAEFAEIADAIDMMCTDAYNISEQNQLYWIQINNEELDASDIEYIRESCEEYTDLFNLDTDFQQLFRKLVIEGQLCWENIVAKDELDAGIIGINMIPNEAYEFAYDMKDKQKMGIMINATLLQEIGLINSFSAINAINTTSLNCGNSLDNGECIFLPFEQLTYCDTGIYSSNGKMVFSPLERARRAYNQLMLIEDAILIYRVSRAPERYVFNVDIGRMNRARGQQEVSRLKAQYGTKKTYDSTSGSLSKTYDPLQLSENWWFVKGKDSEGVKVDTLTSQHQFGNLDDLEYFYKKLYKSLRIPRNRIFDGNYEHKNAPDSINADELHFAKFLMSLLAQFAQGLTNGMITHLKLKGVWDNYKLSNKDVRVIFNPPIEYELYRRQKMLESKVSMMKQVLGEDFANRFSEDFAFKYFMGWDQEQIEENKRKRFTEQVEQAKIKFLLGIIEKKGVDSVTKFFQDANELDLKSLTDISVLNNVADSNNQAADTGDEGDDSDGGDLDFGGDNSGDEGGL